MKTVNLILLCTLAAWESSVFAEGCISHDQLTYIKNNFIKNIEFPGFFDKYVDGLTQFGVDRAHITTLYLRCAKMSTEVGYDISKSGHHPKWVSTLKPGMCVRVLQLSMKRGLREKYIDDGLYGYFFLFENDAKGKIRLRNVGGVVGKEAWSGPCK